MADRKISELAGAPSVASGDVIVVVTGVGVGGSTLATKSLPMSGIMNHVVKIDELTTGGTGIFLNKGIYSDIPNDIKINVTGLAFDGHTHTASQITDFAGAVSGEVQQLIKFQETDLAVTDTTLTESTDLSIPLAANSKYLCQVGTRLLMNEDTDLYGRIKVTGEMTVNYPTSLYGEWKKLIHEAGNILVHHTSTSVSGDGKILNQIGSAAGGLTDVHTIVHEFTAQTTNNEADTISFAFYTDSTNPSTSGVLKKGSWLKAEKII